MARKKERGAPPGTLVYTGEHIEQEININLISYNKKELKELKTTADKAKKALAKNKVNWINIVGIHDSKIVEQIGKDFSINQLILEDILNINQRPKQETLDKNIYVVLKMLDYKPNGKLVTEQISLILGKGYLITFQEKEGDDFESIRKRLVENKGRIRTMGADYLAYAIIDAIIDNYYQTLEKLGDELENIETKVLEEPKQEYQHKLNQTKKELIILRKSIWPLRDVINGLVRSENKLITKDLNIYLKDLYDHIIQAIDTVETYKDTTSSINDLYMSSISNKMNEVMKVLTIFAAIFIPLTFIAGLYGMNFKYMPELSWEFGYSYAIGIMALIGITMLVYFKKKKWL